MIDRLAKLRGKLKEEQQAKESKAGKGDKRFFRFFDCNVGETSTFRYIDDHEDAKNPYFWQEKQMFHWSFVDAENPGDEVKISIPCRNMYVPKTCSVTQLISKNYDEKNPKAKANQMWVTKTYLYQGFVRKTDLVEEDLPENPIRLVENSKKIHTRIYQSLMDEGEETALPAYPTQVEGGLNFIYKVTKQGEYKNYDTSSFSTKPTDLTDDELAAIEQFGHYNLRSLLPVQPSEEAYALLKEMAEACLAGEPWNTAWEEHWKPYRKSDKKEEDTTDTKAKPKTEKAAAKTVVSDDDSQDDEPTKPAVGAATMSVMERLARKKAEAAAAAE